LHADAERRLRKPIQQLPGFTHKQIETGEILKDHILGLNAEALRPRFGKLQISASQAILSEA
jgi:hypothetical protein